MMPRLALADRRHQVDDPGGHVRGIVGDLEPQLLVGEERRQVLEPRPAPGRLRVTAVDGVDLEHRRVLLVAPGRPGQTGHVVALAQPVLAGQLHGDVGVLTARQVALDPQEPVALVAHVEVPRHVDRLVAHRRRRLGVTLDEHHVVALRTVGSTRPALAAAPAAPVAALAVLSAIRDARLAVTALLPRWTVLATAIRPSCRGLVGGAADETFVGGGRHVIDDVRHRIAVGVTIRAGAGAGGPNLQLPLGGRLVERICRSGLHLLGNCCRARITVRRRSVRGCRRRSGESRWRGGVAVGGRRRRARRLEDLHDDVGLLGPRARLHPECFGDCQELVLVLGFQDGLFECLCGHWYLFSGTRPVRGRADGVFRNSSRIRRCAPRRDESHPCSTSGKRGTGCSY